MKKKIYQIITIVWWKERASALLILHLDLCIAKNAPHKYFFNIIFPNSDKLKFDEKIFSLKRKKMRGFCSEKLPCMSYFRYMGTEMYVLCMSYHECLMYVLFSVPGYYYVLFSVPGYGLKSTIRCATFHASFCNNQYFGCQ